MREMDVRNLRDDAVVGVESSLMPLKIEIQMISVFFTIEFGGFHP